MIIIAVVLLAFIYNLPWMYIKYESYGTEVQQIFYIDFKIRDEGALNPKIYDIFNSPCTNCTNNSKNYIGITIDDFSDIPRITFYCSIALILLGVVLTIYAIFDRIKKYSEKINFIVHSTFASGIIIICAIILLVSSKFLGAYFLLYYNWDFVKVVGLDDVRFIFVVPIILVIISIILIKIGTTLIKINFRDIEKKLQFNKKENPYSTYRYGSKLE